MSTDDFSDTRPIGLYDDALGSKSRDYYLDKFEDFDQKGEGWHPSWNWAAFIGGGSWALYRKMYGWFFVWCFVTPMMIGFGKVLGNDTLRQITTLILVAFWLGFSAFANSLYHLKIKARIASAQRANSDPDRVSRRLIAGNGVHAWVLIVALAIPVMGIVAAVVLPVVYQDYNKPKVTSENPFSNPDFGKPVAINPFEATQKITNRSEIDKFLDTPPVKQPATPQLAPFTGTPDKFDPSTARPVDTAKNHPFTYEEAVAPPASITPEQAQEHFRRIDAAHPDANAIVTSPAFQSWVAQYPSYQRIFARGTAPEVIDMITAYKNQR